MIPKLRMIMSDGVTGSIIVATHRCASLTCTIENVCSFFYIQLKIPKEYSKNILLQQPI